MNPFRALELDDIKLLAPSERRAAELLWYLGRYPDDQPAYRSACGAPAAAAYIYPAARFAPPPQPASA